MSVPTYARLPVEFERRRSALLERFVEFMNKANCPDTIALITKAMQHGGYVAGGLVHRMMRQALRDPTRLPNVLDGYLNPSERLNVNPTSLTRYRRGDVDVFFTTPHGLAEFRAWAGKTIAGPHLATSAGRAVEIHADNRIRVQAIERHVGPIEQVLRSFDMFNGMVAFNDREEVVPVGWEQLEHQSELHVVDWSSVLVISRIAKWFTRHEMKALTPESAALLAPRALEIAAALERSTVKTPLGALTPHDIATKFKQLLPHVPNANDLVLLSSLYSLDAYDGPLQQLARRSFGGPIDAMARTSE